MLYLFNNDADFFEQIKRKPFVCIVSVYIKAVYNTKRNSEFFFTILGSVGGKCIVVENLPFFVAFSIPSI